MRDNALKDKLTNRLDTIKDETSVEIIPRTGNVVPFSTNDTQTVSLVPDFAISLNEAKNRLQLLQSFVREMMVPGVDFGIIPGCNKPSLFKPGAEKLCDIFGFSKQIEMMNRLEEWEKGIFHYEIKVTLINKKNGYIEAEGLGCCNNKEKKYKNSDAANVVNTILKMAKKRAFIDAVLSATRSSGIFTQDIEDMDVESPQILPSQTPKPTQSRKVSTTNPKPQNADMSQLNQIIDIICKKKLSFEQAKLLMINRYNVTESKHLSATQAEDFILFLKKYRAS